MGQGRAPSIVVRVGSRDPSEMTIDDGATYATLDEALAAFRAG
jgi:hypothetical protein